MPTPEHLIQNKPSVCVSTWWRSIKSLTDVLNYITYRFLLYSTELYFSIQIRSQTDIMWQCTEQRTNKQIITHLLHVQGQKRLFIHQNYSSKEIPSVELNDKHEKAEKHSGCSVSCACTGALFNSFILSRCIYAVWYGLANNVFDCFHLFLLHLIVSNQKMSNVNG